VTEDWMWAVGARCGETMTDQLNYFEKNRAEFASVTNVLASAFRTVEAMVPPPAFVVVNGSPSLRYKEQNIAQAALQKIARYLSGLNVLLLLLEHGYLQEQGVLQRTLDEISDDIMFLLMVPQTPTEQALHSRYLKAFFEEEFDEGVAPINSTKRRDQVRRKDIRAYIHRRLPTEHGKKASAIVYQTYSGFVHAASPMVMEMCGWLDRKFHIAGMPESNLLASHVDDAWNYFIRGLQNLEMISGSFGNSELRSFLRAQATALERTKS
jgi:hypothetical protein